MNTFYSRIMKSLDSVTEDDISMANERLESTNEDTEEIGVLPDSLIKMWVLMVRCVFDLKRIDSNLLLLVEGSDEEQNLIKKKRKTASKLEIFIALFWAELREEFDIWGIDSIGLCSNFRLVRVLDPLCPGCHKRHPKPKFGDPLDLLVVLQSK